MTTDMTPVVVTALLDVAPDVEAATLRHDALLREDLELDSMDILNLVVAINAATGIDIPGEDYSELTTVGAVAGYLTARAPSRST